MFATRLLIAALAFAGTKAVSVQEVAQHGEINLAQFSSGWGSSGYDSLTCATRECLAQTEEKDWMKGRSGRDCEARGTCRLAQIGGSGSDDYS